MRPTILTLTLGLLLAAMKANGQEWAVADSLTADTLATDSTDYDIAPQRNFNALDYTLDGHHRYYGDRMGRGVTFFQAGGGRMAINDNHEHDPIPFYLLHARLGRQLSRLSSLRIGVSGGIGLVPFYEGENTFYNSINGRGSLDADYLFSISSYLMGYRPERKLDVQGFIGVGAAVSRLFKSDKDEWINDFNSYRTTAMARGGFQLKFFAGPQAAIAVEPYVYLSTNGIDLVRPEHEFYTYRMGMGVDISFIQYFGNRLTDESRAGEFRRRFTRQQRYFASDVPAVLRHHPLIVGLQTGVSGVSGDGRSFNKSSGVGQAAYLGWWMSPAIGLRAGIATDNLKWKEAERESLTRMVAYRNGAIDLMVNPLGFSRSSAWDAPVGLTLLAGYEGGYAFRENDHGFPAFGYRGGISLWARLANGLHVTLEPQYTILIHKNDNSRASTDYLTRVKVGVEMMVGGERETADATAESRFPLGYFVGGGLGRNYTPRFFQERRRDRNWIKSGLIFAGYEYSELHALRAAGEYLTDVFYENGTRDHQGRFLATVGYRLSLSNWLRGINPSRRWTLSANIGPALVFGEGTSKLGANVGLQLDYRLSKHFSLFLAQNLYWMRGGLYDTEQTTDADMTNTFNLGMAYHFESLVQPTISLAQTTARAIGSAGAATGRAVGAAGIAVGQAVGTAGIAVGQAVGTAGIAVGQASASVGRAVGSLGAMTGRAIVRTADAVTDQEGRPLFLEYALGYHHLTDMPTDGIDTWEPLTQIGVGWWPLPLVGVRAGTEFLRGSSGEYTVSAPNGTLTVYQRMRLSFVYADVLLNPLGFARHYNWQSAAGVNLVGGRLLANMTDNEVDRHYWKSGWRAGMQLWARIDDGLRLHVEPLFTHFNCKPQWDVPAEYVHRQYHNLLAMNVGLTVLMGTQPRPATRQTDTQPGEDARKRWFAGVGGGLHFNKDDYRMAGSGTNTNLMLTGGYRVWRNSAVRLTAELTTDHFTDNYYYAITSGPSAGTERGGLAKSTFRFLFSSAVWQYDLLALASHNDRRRWQMNVFGGVGLSSYLGETTRVIDETADYELLGVVRNNKVNFYATGGVMVTCRVSNRLSTFLSHQLYQYSLNRPQWIHYSPQVQTHLGNINTFNIGLLCDLPF